MAELRLDQGQALCKLCRGVILEGEDYLIVYQGNMGDKRLAAPENRAGIIHLQHLLNVFDPTKVQLTITEERLRMQNRFEIVVPWW